MIKIQNSLSRKCYAIITRDKDVALCVVVADCNPVIIWDDTQGVVAVAHAGRVGSYSSIVKKTILKLEKEFMCHKENLNVSIGPSIRECCYEVGAEVIDGFEEYVVKRDGKLFLDLIQLNLHDLKKVGIKKENIEVSPICTCCNKNYFSYRREATKERFCGVAYLE